MTPQTLAVLAALLDNEDREAWGFELSRSTGLAAGTMYPILARLMAAGWVEDRWESPEPGRVAGRPPRRYYRLSVQGRARAGHALESQVRPPGRLGRARPGATS